MAERCVVKDEARKSRRWNRVRRCMTSSSFTTHLSAIKPAALTSTRRPSSLLLGHDGVRRAGWPSLLQAGCEAQETSARTLIKIERSTPHRQLKVSWAYGPRLEASRATQRKRGLVLPPRLRFGLVSASTVRGISAHSTTKGRRSRSWTKITAGRSGRSISASLNCKPNSEEGRCHACR